ncbi:MAG: hypothetical protein ACRDWD_11840 [Acidimicrobiia bacterium]
MAVKEVLIAIGPAMVTAIVGTTLASVLLRRKDVQIEKLRARLSDDAAFRDYRYEARRELLSELQPILFLLAERCEDAYWRLTGIAKAARDGRLDLSAHKRRLRENSNYYLPSTIYRLMAPHVMFRLCEAHLGRFDLSLVPEVKEQYLLAKGLYRTWNGGDALARCLPDVPYDPGGVSPTEAGYKASVHARQHMRLGAVDEIIDQLTVRKADGSARCMAYGEFQKAYTSKDSALGDAIERLRTILVDFHPQHKPVLWRILLAQAALQRSIIEAFNTPPEEPRKAAPEKTPSVRGAMVERSRFDWRRPNSDVSDSDALDSPFQAVHQYLAEHTNTKQRSRLANAPLGA